MRTTILMVLAAILFAPAAPMAGPSGDDGWELIPGGSLNADPVTVSALAGHAGIPRGGSADVAVVLDIASGWHVNSHEPLEEWLIATELLFEEPPFDVIETVFPEHEEMMFAFSDEPMAVYEGKVVIGLRVGIREGFEGSTLPVSGHVVVQACDDRSCLAPVEKPFWIELPVLAAGATPASKNAGLFAALAFSANPAEGTAQVATTTPYPNASGGVSGEDEGLRARLTRALARNFGNPLIAVVIIFFAGLLSAATPCVYPMIPITVRILMGRGGDNPALGRLHAFMYFVGIVIIYAVLGFVASATGGGFNEILRIPLVILSFAMLFALLGLSMLGLFEIQMPASWQTKVDSSTSSRTGLAGTTMMGVGAGLVVSPCVGPVVIFILTQIAAQIAAVQAEGGGSLSTAGQLFYGGFLMAGYGAGLGIPFLIVGLFSARMAKPGSWMTVVRVVLGVVILYFAYDYFHKALATAGVDRPVANAIITGIVLIFLSVLWGVFRTRIEDGPHAGWHKTRLAVTIIMLIVGIFYLWTGMRESGLVAGTSPSGGSTIAVAPGGPKMEDSHGLVWHRDLEAARQEAAESGLPIFLDFYAHWCANCKVFSKQAAEAGPLRDALEQVVRAKIYDTDPVFDEFKNDPRFPELKRGLPFFVILSSDGEFLWKGTDYRAHDVFIDQLARAKTSAGR
jgi:thiol:disulfide interchange protein DsbD